MSTLRLTTPRIPDPLEAVHQERVMMLAALHEFQHPELALLFAIPNGGHRAKATAAALKRQGVKRGVPDLCLPVPRCGFHGLWIELKRLRDSSPTEEQKEWIERLTAQGYRAVVRRGSDAAWSEILTYLKGEIICESNDKSPLESTGE